MTINIFDLQEAFIFVFYWPLLWLAAFNVTIALTLALLIGVVSVSNRISG